MRSFAFDVFHLPNFAFPAVFQEIYGFSIGVGGLVYIGLGLGFLLATIFGAQTADQIYHHVGQIDTLALRMLTICQLARKNGGVGKPEMRIPALFVGSFFVPIGLL